MKVLMIPHADRFRENAKTESGIRRVVEAYFEHLPKYGVELVPENAQSYDLKAVHAGTTGRDCDVSHNHGLYWTADYSAQAWEWEANAKVIEAARHARQVTVPSNWVAETFARDMHFWPTVVPHGIDWDAWQHSEASQGYVLWNKNRAHDVCNPEAVGVLAAAYQDVQFVTTFAPNRANNIHEIGLRPHHEMKQLIQRAGVYLATTKETFGIGILEAMASGIPVLGFAHGGIVDLVEHGVSGFLAAPGDWDGLKNGLAYCFQHWATLGANGREAARNFTWDEACGIVAEVYERALKKDPATCAIVIPSYKYAEKVGTAVKSAMGQDYPFLTDIVVVDDGSPDDGATQRAVEQAKEDFLSAVKGSIGAARETVVQLKERLKEMDSEVWEQGNIELNRKSIREEITKRNVQIATLKKLSERPGIVRYIRQENQGVAVARNNGIASCGATYICCLDADDEMEEPYIGTCVKSLEEDPSLGIAFTRLKLKVPNGNVYDRTKWPNAPDFAQQIAGRNQVPTFAVFRREAWERCGGYRQRYAPEGCGVEDAEMFTRMGAQGWGMALASEKPMVIYSFGEGGTTGRRDYKELDWLAWHPWVRDHLHPFASIAPPKNHSHPVRQYDQPMVSVVIPVGPGHENQIINALDSLEAQTLRQWEAIVAWDTGDPVPEKFEKAFPFVYWVEVGGKGAGAARNQGMRYARAPLTLFLDADDWLYPEALEVKVTTYSEEGGDIAVYSDFIGLAYVNDPDKLDPKLKRRILDYRADGRAVISNVALDYDYETAMQQPDLKHPFLWNTVVTLFPTAWHDEIGGFDEDMPSWEDWDYFLRMAREGKDFIRVPRELFVYQFYSGQRREWGLQNAESLVQYMRDKYKEKPAKMCKRCRKPRAAVPAPAAHAAYSEQRAAVALSQVDSQFILCEYTHANRGDHSVIGSAQFRDRLPGVKMRGKTSQGQTVWVVDYGYHGGGAQFPVHRRDIELGQGLFRPLSMDTQQVVLPQGRTVMPAAPSPTIEKAPRPSNDPLAELLEAFEAPRAPQPVQPAQPATPPPVPVGRDPVEQLLADIPQSKLDALGIDDHGEPVQAVPQVPKKTDFQSIPGVSADIADQMIQSGLDTMDDLKAFIQTNGVSGLKIYFKGVGDRKAESIAAYVMGAVETAPPPITDGVPPELAELGIKA